MKSPKIRSPKIQSPKIDESKSIPFDEINETFSEEYYFSIKDDHQKDHIYICPECKTVWKNKDEFFVCPCYMDNYYKSKT
jgi:rubrerythrin